jgi:probable rRNA maturation factor
MSDPPSPTVVVSDEQDAVAVDGPRWAELARAVLAAEGRSGELTLTFVDTAEITELNREHMGTAGATDVLSFPLDADAESLPGVPVLLGDVVVCPAVAAANAPTHAGTLDDELALLVVHGVLHVLGHDHAEPEETVQMRAAELDHLKQRHWHGPAPVGFRQEQDLHA